MRIFIDYQDEKTPSMMREVEVVPCIGQKVGVRQPDGMKGTDTYALDFVVDVRHYYPLNEPPEIRVMTSSRR